jgi:TATA-binding protein-associated factor Taf7
LEINKQEIIIFFFLFQIGKAIRRISGETDAINAKKKNNNNNTEDDVEDVDEDNDSNDCLLSNHKSNSKKKHRRNRTTFTTFQLHELERAFEKSRKRFPSSFIFEIYYFCFGLL